MLVHWHVGGGGGALARWRDVGTLTEEGARWHVSGGGGVSTKIPGSIPCQLYPAYALLTKYIKGYHMLLFYP